MATEEKREIPVDIVDSIDSTNSFIKRNCVSLPNHFTLRARIQTAGRGRFERTWVGVPDEDLMFSTLIHVSEKLQDKIIHIPQITALAVNDTIYKLGVPSRIKWPNDLLVNGKKLSGILVEGIFQGGIQHLVIGVGLNLNSLTREGVEIPQSSIFSETGQRNDPDSVMISIVHGIFDRIDQLERNGFEPFPPELNRLLAYRNETKTITVSGKQRVGVIEGVGESGGLLFRNTNGVLEEIISGEISFHGH